MIIDAKTNHHRDYRNFSAKGAVAHAVANMKAGETITVEKAVDALGRAIELSRVQITISAIKGTRAFQTRAGPAPLLATIYRVA